jgi:hypothetical protein
MEMTPKAQQKKGDHIGLSTVGLLVVIAEKEDRLSAQAEQVQL